MTTGMGALPPVGPHGSCPALDDVQSIMRGVYVLVCAARSPCNMLVKIAGGFYAVNQVVGVG
jgi:hypothetical protein